MGNLVSFQRDQRLQSVLVLASTTDDWVPVTGILEDHAASYFASYYLIEQIEALSSAGLLGHYCACILVGAEFLSIEDKQQVELLADELPIIWFKQSDNIYDIALERFCSEVITPSELADLDIRNSLDQGKRVYSARKAEAQEGVHLRYGDGGDIYQSAVVGAEVYDANHVVSDVVNSLRLIARTQGVDIHWEQHNENYKVLLNEVETRRAIMSLMLAMFEYFEHVSLKISPSSLLADHCVWLDISAGKQRRSALVSDKVPNLDDELLTLKKALNMNQGELFELENTAKSVTIRLEWLAFSDY